MPVTQQGSRAGMITTIVILAITSVLAIIMAFYFSAEKRKVEQTNTALQAKYKEYITESSLQGGELPLLKDYAKANGLGDQPKGWDILLAQRAQLIKSINGKEASDANTVSTATQNVTEALGEAAKKFEAAKLNLTLPSTSDNLTGAVSLLADKVISQQTAMAQRDKQVEDANAIVARQADEQKKALEQKDAEVAKIRAEADKAVADASADRKAKQDQIEKMEAERETERKTAADTAQKKDVDITAAKEESRKLQERLTAAQARFDKMRVGVTEPVLRHGDGKIVGLGAKDYVTINLGRGDQLVPGMTFEVYDKNKGIPKLPQIPADNEMPAGKASLEVTSVNESSSQCRITRLANGAQLVDGDIIMNVVYDPQVKYNFYVFGKFDLDRNGVATAQDTDVVKRLIGQWGGKVMDGINVDTDFIVLGIQPEVPNYSAEELTQPENVKKKADAEKELDQYHDIVQKARELHIPILNQNRFLYFTGFFDLVKR